jgi:hypothetical protein
MFAGRQQLKLVGTRRRKGATTSTTALIVLGLVGWLDWSRSQRSLGGPSGRRDAQHPALDWDAP